MATQDNVLYLEADEDITSAIDKLNKSKGASLSVVVPKRSTLLQSLINLKLLKKAADDAGKDLVLVTVDRTATHLAGRVGLPVAATLGAKAAIPETNSPEPADTSEVIESDPAKPVPTAVEPPQPESTEADEETSNETEETPSAAPVIERKPLTEASAAAASASAGSRAKKSSVKVPDFTAMQKRLLIGGGIIGLIILYFIGMYFFATANVSLFAQATRQPTDFGFSVDTSGGKSDFNQGVIVGQDLQSNKTLSATALATGKQDVGTKATGTMTVSNCFDDKPHTLVSGTRFQSSDGKIFRSTQDVTVPGGAGSFFGCVVPGTAQVGVQADQSGDQYNLASGTKYTIPALPANQQSGINGTGNQMSGGTSKQITVLTQADVDKAVNDAESKDKDGAQKDLEGKVPSGYKTITDSFSQTTAGVDNSTAVGSEATSAQLSVHVAYSELAINKADLDTLAKQKEQQEAGQNQQVYDSGIDTAKITPASKSGNSFTYAADAYVGPKLDTLAVAKQLAGKRYGDAADTASHLPGVDRAEISLTPGWASGLPHIASHIKVQIKVSNPSG